jgi:tetratricopeptide (TPR) repeat protein
LSARRVPGGRRRVSRQAAAPSPSSRASLTLGKKALFALLAVTLFFALLEVVLLLAGVRPLLAERDPYVGFTSQVPLLAEREVDGQPMMETAPNKLRWFNLQRFPRHKAPGTYRIFSLGGSTTYGHPYDDRASFSAWLRELLAEADAPGKFEVINAGGISYASYRVLRVMEELSAYEPDLFIVYTGHNEFLEERTYRDVNRMPAVLRNLGGLLAHTRTYAVVHRLVLRQDVAEPTKVGHHARHDDHELRDEVFTRLDGGVGPDAYRRDEPLAGRVLEHFRYNLPRMVDVAHQAGAEIVFVVPAANLADCSPFKSEHEANFAAQAAWQRHYDQAQQAYDQQRFDDARQTIDQALQLAPRHAQTHYLRGRILQQLHQYDLAKAAFIRARDEDICPLRAISGMVQIVREVAFAQHVPLIDFERMIDDHSQHGLPGASLFLDHVHPTIAGHRMLALALFDYLADHQVVRRPEEWDAKVERVVQRVEGRVDQKAQGEALRNLSKVLAWAGKKDEANQLALRASELLGGDAETAYLAGNALLEAGKTDEAMAKFQEALRIDPNHVQAHNSLGSAYLRQGDLDAALRHFQRVIQLQPDFAPVQNNLGALYQQRNEVELAIQHYREAIRLNPHYSKAYNNVGVLLRKQARWDAAADYFRQALTINPDFAEAHFNLGTIFDQQGDASSAAAEYQQALRLNPRYGPAHQRLGMQLERQGQWRAAAQAYRRALQGPVPSVDTARRLAWLLATSPDSSLRNGPMALDMARQCATTTRHADAEVLSTLAAAYAATGDFANAVKWQAEALRLSPAQDQPRHQTRLEALRAGRVPSSS